MLRSMLATLFASTAVLLSCTQSERQPPSSSVDGPVVRARVYKDGSVTVDDKAATIIDVRAALDRLRSERGTVLYYREAGQEEPPPVAMEVMRAIVDAKLPVQLSTKPDFSDAVGSDGVPKPR